MKTEGERVFEPAGGADPVSQPWLHVVATGSDGGGVRLSPRERETLELLLTGAPQKQIADRMGVTTHTAHDYVKALYKKLGVNSRAELMARALGRP